MKLQVVDENGAKVDEGYELRLPGWTEERNFAEAPEQGFYEFKDGELIVHSPVNRGHQDIVRFLTYLLGDVVYRKRLGEVVNGPGVFRVRENLDREPDIVFVSNESLASRREQYAGAADFVIEVVSPGGRRRDRDEKAGEYEAARVAEYWAVDPARRELVVHRLAPERPDRSRGLSPKQATPGGKRFAVETVTEGRLESTAVPGFRIEVEWLWQRPLPNQFDCLRELAD